MVRHADAESPTPTPGNHCEKARKAAVRKWSATPTPNRGATPVDVGRALLGKPVRHTTGKVAGNGPAVKSRV